jgi:hypothetical protein
MTLRGAVLTNAPPALVLVAGGTPAAVAGLQAQAAPLLAQALGLRLREPLPPLTPDVALEALTAGEEHEPVLAPLPRDPGQPLADGRHWAAALGAWRQPVLLLLDGEQLASGLPAAQAALLQQWQVPCLGLVQWGGSWDSQTRRRDGLPWLGPLAAGDALELGLALRQAAALRWSALRAALEEAPLA